jgi:hypothetical protein
MRPVHRISSFFLNDHYRPNVSRHNQSINVTATSPRASATIARSLGGRVNQRPRSAEAMSQGPANAAAPASNVPPQFDSRAAIQCPRTACAHDVVMPHEGQRTPNSQTNVHGGRPSRWCVPNPFGSGRKQPATTKGAKQHIPAAASDSRQRTESRSGPFSTLWVTLRCGKGAGD